MIRLVTVVALLFNATPPADVSNLALARQAEQAYQKGIEHAETPLLALQNFQNAEKLFLDLHQRGVRTVALYRNLGNAALHAGHLDRAIWAFHHGRDRAPHDPSWSQRLATARALVAYVHDPDDRPDDPAPLLPGSTWNVLAIGLSLLSCGLLVVGTLRRRRWLTVFGLAGFVALLAVLGRNVPRVTLEPVAVVSEANVPLRTGNGPSYPPVEVSARLPVGQEVRVQFQRGGWLQVRLPAGRVGWLPAASLLVVEAEAG